MTGAAVAVAMATLVGACASISIVPAPATFYVGAPPVVQVPAAAPLVLKGR